MFKTEPGNPPEPDFAAWPDATFGDQARALISADILTGALAPGSKLAIRILSERYSIGPTPLREALSRLCETGLVQALPRLGFVVAPLSRRDLEEVVWLRRQIEGEALRQAMERGDPEWEGAVAAATHGLLKAAREADDMSVLGLEFDIIHKRFHYALLSGSRSTRLLDLFGMFYDQTYRYRRIAMASPAWVAGFITEHAELSALVLSGDSKAARARLDKHLNDVLTMAYDEPARTAPKRRRSVR